MTAYYNEIDPYAAQWLRNLIKAGHIAAGDVDERSIVDVHADDLRGYTQCHFFAGIGGWSIALRLAGWPDDRPVWTGSCPCQPFSTAGKGKAGDDERHLWPAWFPLIAKCRPPIVFGEQVEAAVGWGWVDAVFSDLENEGYTCGATVLPACGVGAPHIRQRLWFVADADTGGRAQRQRGRVDSSCELESWGATPRNDSEISNAGAFSTVADADGGDASAERQQRSGQHGQRAQNGSPSKLADTSSSREERQTVSAWERLSDNDRRGKIIDMADTSGRGQREFGDETQPRRGRYDDGGSILNGFWSDAEWIACTDGKARPVGPGSFPLGHGIQRRASKLRAYGNAIVPQVAAEFIMAACGDH